MPVLKVKFAKRLEVLLPFFYKVRWDHHNHGTTRASDSHAVCNRQRDEGLAHTHFVSQYYAWLVT
jgi:hypothetical protein